MILSFNFYSFGGEKVNIAALLVYVQFFTYSIKHAEAVARRQLGLLGNIIQQEAL